MPVFTAPPLHVPLLQVNTDLMDPAWARYFSDVNSLTREEVASTASITKLSSRNPTVRITGNTNTTLHGIESGIDGQRLLLVTLGAQITIKNQSASATGVDRIFSFGASDKVIGSGGAVAAAEFVYDKTAGSWLLTHAQDS